MPNYNENFRRIASQLASGIATIGSDLWNKHGDFTQPWYTGGHYSEGWTHGHLFDGKALPYQSAARLALSNSAARPRYDVPNPLREVGYGVGERPKGWKLSTFNGVDTLDGGQIIDGIPVYGHDSEHFLHGPIFELANLKYPPFLLPWVEWEPGVPLLLDSGSLAATIVAAIQWSTLGEMRPWGTNRLPDRSMARLLYALFRTAGVVGLAEPDADAIVRLWWTYWQAAPATIDKTVVTDPQVGSPVWIPVHHLGYGIPAWYWLSQPGWPSGISFTPTLQAKCQQLTNFVGDDGSMPWAVDLNGVAGYFTAPNGDKYTPGYEVYTALRIAGDVFHVEHALDRAKAIHDRWASKPDGDFTKELQRAWFADSNRNAVL